LSKPHGIITGQRIDPVKLKRAKELRRQLTPAEKKLWAKLRRNQLGFHFRRQQIIEGFIVDFYCNKAGLALEVDGSIHKQQEDYDADREELLTKRGLNIMRFTNEEVMLHLEDVLDHIAAKCQARAEEFGG